MWAQQKLLTLDQPSDVHTQMYACRGTLFSTKALIFKVYITKEKTPRLFNQA